MKPFVKYGLIVGGIALLIIVPVSVFMGICGPGVTLIAGALAGFLAVGSARPALRSEGARSGAIAGAIAGAVTLLGQALASVLVLVFFQYTGTAVPFGRVPEAGGPMAEVIPYYVSGLGAGLCFGLIGLVLGALAGTLAGALATPEAPAAVPSAPLQPQ